MSVLPLQIKDILLPVGSVLAIFFIALLFPAFGVIVGILSPVPLVLIHLRRGREVGLISAGLVLLAILLTMGGKYAAFFFAEYVAMAVILAETIRLQFPLDKSIFLAAFGSAALSLILLLAVFSDSDVPMEDFIRQQLSTHFEQSMEAFKAAGKSQEEMDSMKGFFESASQSLAALYPAFILLGSLFGTVVNYAAARFLWIRFYGQSPFFAGRFSEWLLPDFCIWLVIFSAGVLFLPEGASRAVGLNVFILMLVIYCLQGLAVTVHFLASKNIPVFLWIPLLILVLAQPPLIGILIGLGLFDLWVDFRKLRLTPSHREKADKKDNSEF